MGRARVRLGLVVAAAIAAPAYAERGAIVVPSAEPAVDAVALAAALSSAGIAAVDPVAQAAAARRAGAEPRSTIARFAEVTAVVSEGWRAYASADPEFAAARLAAARTAALELVPLDGGAALYADASLRLGVTLHHLGRQPAADEALRLAAALDPDRAVTTAEFTPEAVDAYARARGAAPPPVPVRIEALTGAAIAVDGVAVGVAPATVSVTPGTHVIVARHPRYVAQALAIEVSAATPLVAIELPPDRELAALARAGADGLGGLDDDERARAIEATLTYADLDDLLVVASIVRAGAPALVAQRCVGGRACTGVVEVGYGTASIATAIAMLVERLASAPTRYGVVLVDDPRVRQRGGTGPIRGGRDRRWWYWVGGGAAVAAAIAVAVVVASGGDGATSVTIDPGDFTGP